MSIIFCGDLVLPYYVTVDYKEVVPLFEDCKAIANMEGALLKEEKELNLYRWRDKFSLYSCPGVLDIMKVLHVEAVSLCNNHILDYQHDIEDTVETLRQNGVKSWGLRNHDVIETKLNGKRVFIITFATFSNEHSLNLFSPRKVVKEVCKLKKENPDCYIVIFPHWGREKFYYPEPADRTLAHYLIDAGADLIVGHHSHVVQPIETYKGKKIFYSLGNFILPQAFYANKKLVYKQQEVMDEFIVKWDGEKSEVFVLHFDAEKNVLHLNPSYNLEKETSFFCTNYSWWRYCLLFCSHSSLMDIVFRTRYFSNSLGERLCWLQRTIFRQIRKAIIKLGLHNPYKDSVK